MGKATLHDLAVCAQRGGFPPWFSRAGKKQDGLRFSRKSSVVWIDFNPKVLAVDDGLRYLFLYSFHFFPSNYLNR